MTRYQFTKIACPGAHPNRVWEGPDALRCARCGEPIMEAVYWGGWMHCMTVPHPFMSFTYSDGAEEIGGGCVTCAARYADPRHAGSVEVRNPGHTYTRPY